MNGEKKIVTGKRLKQSGKYLSRNLESLSGDSKYKDNRLFPGRTR